MQTVADTVTQILVEQLGVDASEVTPEASIVDDLTADSLDTVEIVMACEDVFGIEIPDADEEQMKTVGNIIRYIEERLTTDSKRGAHV